MTLGAFHERFDITWRMGSFVKHLVFCEIFPVSCHIWQFPRHFASGVMVDLTLDYFCLAMSLWLHSEFSET